MIGLETERLIFRQWTQEDYPVFKSYFSDPISSKYVGGIKNPEEAWRLLASYIGHYELYGYSYLAVTEKTSKKLIGSVGLWNSPPWPEPELGYWLIPEFQGKSYAFEAALALKNYALERLNMISLVSYISSDNIPSQKLALRLGAKYDKEIDLLDFGKHEVYRYK